MSYLDNLQATNNPPTSDYWIGLIVTIIFLLFVLFGLVYAIRKYLKTVAWAREKELHKKLEKLTGWRVAKVIYWLVLILMSGVLILNSGDSYDKYPTLWLGIILLAISYPLYILYARLFGYILGLTSKHGT